MSKVLVISTSLRLKSNSDALAESLIRGARDAGHEVEHISLKGKDLKFCTGCLACQKTQQCVLKDDAVRIAERVKASDTLVFATPIYYYEMSGQMKTLLDRLNPLYPSDYRFRKVYMLMTAAEDEAFVPEKAVSGLQGWVDCTGICKEHPFTAVHLLKETITHPGADTPICPRFSHAFFCGAGALMRCGR